MVMDLQPDKVKPKISIVIPVFNVENYLAICLESIINQTIENIEIIIVNDCSEDNSEDVINRYLAIDSRIVYIKLEQNVGLSGARNVGIKAANGEYIAFVDSDDFVELDMYESMLNKSIKYDCDVAICGGYLVYENGRKKSPQKASAKDRLVQGNDCLPLFFSKDFLNYAWNKLFRRAFLIENNIEFPIGLYYEDLYAAVQIGFHANRIAVLSDLHYNYLQRTNSITKVISPKHIIDYFEIFKNIRNFMLEKGVFYPYIEKYYQRFHRYCVANATNKIKGYSRNSLEKKQLYRVYFEQMQKNLHIDDLVMIGGYAGYVLNSTWARRDWWFKFGRLKPKERKKRIAKIILKKSRIGSPFKKGTPLYSFGSWISKRTKNIFRSVSALRKNNFYTKKFENLEIEENAILFESFWGKDISGSPFAMLKELYTNPIYSGYRLYVTAKGNKSRVQKKIDSHFENVKYPQNEIIVLGEGTKEYLRALASVKYLVNNTTFPKYFIKKEGQIYLNTWHGTPFKGLGRSNNAEMHLIGNVQRNFLMSDFLLFQNEYTKTHMMRDYDFEANYSGTSLVGGYPRNNVLFCEQTRNTIRDALEVGDKKIIVYMPTWRSVDGKVNNFALYTFLLKFLQELDAKFADANDCDFVLFVKLHHFCKFKIDFGSYRGVSHVPANMDSYELLAASDALITDYSSILFDYSATKKPILLCPFDEKEYLSDRGFYFDYNELPFPKYMTSSELIDGMANISHYKMDKDFIGKFCSFDGTESASVLVKRLLENEFSTSLIEQKHSSSNKRNVLIFCSTFEPSNHVLSLMSYLKELAKDLSTNYYLSFYQEKVKGKEQLELVRKIPREIKFFPICFDGKNHTIGEHIFKKLGAIGLYFPFISKRVFRRNMQRELTRIFYGVQFDSLVHYYGHDQYITPLLEEIQIDNSKTIFLHHPKEKQQNQYEKIAKHSVQKTLGKYDMIAANPVVDIKRLKNGIANKIHPVCSGTFADWVIGKSKESLCFSNKTVSSHSVLFTREIVESTENEILICTATEMHTNDVMQLIKSFYEYRKRHPHSYLFVVWDSSQDVPNAEKMIKKYKDESHLVLLCNLENIFSILASCDVVIWGANKYGKGKIPNYFSEIVLLNKTILTICETLHGAISEHSILISNTDVGIEEGIKQTKENHATKFDIQEMKFKEQMAPVFGIKEQMTPVFGVQGKK